MGCPRSGCPGWWPATGPRARPRSVTTASEPHNNCSVRHGRLHRPARTGARAAVRDRGRGHDQSRTRGAGCRGCAWPPGQARRSLLVGSGLLTGRLRRGRRRRCRWRAGRGCRGLGRSASSGAGRRVSRLPARPGAGPRRRGRRDECMSSRVRPDWLADRGAAGCPADDRAVPCRSSRQPSGVRKMGPSTRSPTARSIARAVPGASGMVTTLPPLRVMTSVQCPRSVPRASMLAPAASDTRSPFKASSEISPCSAGWPSPAATRIAPSSLRSSPVACES